MWAKCCSVCQRGADRLLKPIVKSTAFFAVVLVVVGLASFCLGYFRSPGDNPFLRSEAVEAGPVPFILNQTVSTLEVTRRPQHRRRDRTQVKIFVGIFTAADGERGEFGKRRKAIRETFLPELSQTDGVATRFVIGRASDNKLQSSMDLEEGRYPDSFLTLEAEDCAGCWELRKCSACMIQKTLSFFHAVNERYDAGWLLKVDDDVYLAPRRLLAAAAQWSYIGTEYVGCMKTGVVLDQPQHRWFEPSWKLLGTKYPMHAFASIYGVSGRVVSDAIVPNADMLRRLSFEDTTMGLWMLAFNVTFFEDRRLCQPRCHTHAAAFFDISCGGLCDPVQDMFKLHRNFLCTRAVPNGGPLRYLPSGPGHGNFDAMRVLI